VREDGAAADLIVVDLAKEELLAMVATSHIAKAVAVVIRGTVGSDVVCNHTHPAARHSTAAAATPTTHCSPG
jgi:hypothetical protein